MNALTEVWSCFDLGARVLRGALKRWWKRLAALMSGMIHGLTEVWRFWGQRVQLLSYLLLGTAFAVGHHFMCQSLDGKAIRTNRFHVFGRVLSDQTVVSAGSNVLAQLINYCFAATMGVAFVQYFWNVIEPFASHREDDDNSSQEPKRSDEEGLEAIDAAVAAAPGNPFLPSSFRTWFVAPGLAVIAFMMLLLVLIPTFAPGSLRVITPDFRVPTSCTIATPNLTLVDGLLSDPETLFTNILTSGSYLPLRSPCGRCAYNVTFQAVSLDCALSPDYDFTSFQAVPEGELVLYNATFTWDPSFVLTVAYRDGSLDSLSPPRAVRCTGYSTMYHTQVSHNTTSWAQVLSQTVGDPINNATLTDATIPYEPFLMLDSIGWVLTGSVVRGNDRADDQSLPVTHWLDRKYAIGSGFAWPSIGSALPSLVQNMSLSLLSGHFAPWNETYFDDIPGTCMSTQPVFEYIKWRLLTIYGIGWIAAAGCLGVGFWFVGRNGRERDMDFSNLVDALNDEPLAKHHQGTVP
ncbi:hypothetical protein D9611_010690 [Ephemerocybe angulata]|uniref:Uncharacterized protein n=1 Tax=Ephemerocybe angulata TaxID=980116 RepID=A0A8H5BBT7_9AGAR|nr:hypothetical protein D9611_010690 [Tulosesus angulatus]